MSSRARPELQAPPEIFYNDDEARKYTSSSRIIDIQAKLSERALELLALPDDDMPRLLLDIGCGSGLSGETLTENGHQWIGLDISSSMLNIALEREVDGDLILGDMGQGLGLRPGVIDGAISISAVQWLCNADKSSHEPRLRLKAFFGSLYRSLARGARAVLQVYPENLAQRELILGFAMRAGFSGGIVVDFPHSTKQRKEYLVLTCGPPSLSSAAAKGKGPSSSEQLSSPLSSAAAKGKGEDGEESCPDDDGSGDKENKSVHVSDKVHAKGKGEDGEESCSDDDGSGDEENKSVHVSDRHRPRKKQKLNKKVKGREWVLHKKEQLRRKGNTVPLDTKYTARKRKARF